jgi:nitroreductase
MLLMTTALGLGACWVIAPCIDIRDEELIKELFNIPEGIKAISIISIGHPVREHRPRPRLPIQDIVFKEKWGDPYYRGEA